MSLSNWIELLVKPVEKIKYSILVKIVHTVFYICCTHSILLGHRLSILLNLGCITTQFIMLGFIFSVIEHLGNVILSQMSRAVGNSINIPIR
ncbi:hypothetical protein JHK82_035388 [Glycine max]|nr:hypothetical protein JHK87_035318 [Glycine soja]KAG4969689.1 hypothetical protein JHK85_036110 [Glycine max]KAG4976044.1 hypothetical protein JHK86_035518 [Glycine max]KAG5112119.1 hypothetical protein JHK82_035388 [Glycine max]KAG5129403.1 hypothetical protein JHK84_035800 [Glycine max]